MDILKGLNERQAEAVQLTEGYLRVIAGAGSGKTKLLVSRYAYLVGECGIDPGNILCITFTNKAAGEMRRRIRTVIGEGYDTSLICTYHGFCARVLRDDIEKLFFPKSFQIIDTTQQKAILGEIYESLELKLDHASFEKIIKEISAYKAVSDYIPYMCDTSPETESDEKDISSSIIRRYLLKQKQIYALDFQDLIYFAIYLFENYPEILEKWQKKLNYIQVDEFQDSSATELKLISLLSGYYKNLMIVGDPDQNIYEWRGSDVRLLVDFDKSFLPTTTVFLNQNYRSTPQILDCANALIANNTFRLKKDLFTKSESGSPTEYHHFKNEYEEAEFIANEILRLKSSGERYSDAAILYRSGFLSRIIEKKLAENAVPYEIFGGVRFFDRMEIQDIIAYLRLIAYDDDNSFKRIVNKPRRKFGKVKLQRLSELRRSGESLFDTLKQNIDDRVFAGSKIRELVEMIDRVRSMSAFSPISGIVNTLCQLSGYEQYIRELGDMERFDNLTEFKRIANEYESTMGEEINLNDFLGQLALQFDYEEEERDTAKLMTVHASKGLEFRNVFIFGASEGIFPSPKTVEERKQLGLEEERRLCYVAITRAQKRLYITESEGLTNVGKVKEPSRFIREIGLEKLKQFGNIPKEILNLPAPLEITDQSELLAVGTKIEHKIFGDGEIEEIDEKTRSYRIGFASMENTRNISFSYFSPKQETTEEPCVPDISDTSDKEHDESGSEAEPSENIEDTEKAPRSLWKSSVFNDPDFPLTGWHCEGVSDVGEPVFLCQACGHQLVRYTHHMVHESGMKLITGCVCAGKLEGDIKAARQREQAFKKSESQRAAFMRKEWKTSRNGNAYMKYKDRVLVLYQIPGRNVWKYSIDNIFSKQSFPSKEKAIEALYTELCVGC